MVITSNGDYKQTLETYTVSWYTTIINNTAKRRHLNYSGFNEKEKYGTFRSVGTQFVLTTLHNT